MLRPREEAVILGIVASTPELDGWRENDLFQRYQELASDPIAPDPGVIRDLRDMVFALCDLDRPGRLHPIVEFVASLADACETASAASADPADRTAFNDLSARMRLWTNAVSGRQGTWNLLHDRAASSPKAGDGAGPTPATPKSIIIILDPVQDTGLFTVTVVRYRSRADSRYMVLDGTPRSIEGAMQKVREVFRAAARELGGSPLIELVVPQHLFDTDFPLWQVFERPYRPASQGSGQAANTSRDWARLGYRYPIVIRSLERFNDAEYRERAGPIWDSLSAQSGVPLTWVDCRLQYSPGELAQLMARQPEPATDPDRPPTPDHRVLGLTFPAADGHGDELMDAALWSQAPVAVWRRVPCAQHDGGRPADGPCDGLKFRSDMEPKISVTRLYDLPLWAMRARNNGGPNGTELVLLWDNPHSGPSPCPLFA
jgi:hypothetical protein